MNRGDFIMEDTKTLSLVVLGSVAVVAVLGLVMLFNSDTVVTGADIWAGQERQSMSNPGASLCPTGVGGREPMGHCTVTTEGVGGVGENTNVYAVFCQAELDALHQTPRLKRVNCQMK